MEPYQKKKPQLCEGEVVFMYEIQLLLSYEQRMESIFDAQGYVPWSHHSWNNLLRWQEGEKKVYLYICILLPQIFLLFLQVNIRPS